MSGRYVFGVRPIVIKVDRFFHERWCDGCFKDVPLEHFHMFDEKSGARLCCLCVVCGGDVANLLHVGSTMRGESRPISSIKPI